MTDEWLRADQVATVRDGVNYARIALNGWKDGQWERVPKGWHLAAWAEEVDRLATSHAALAARLAAVEGERAAALAAVRDVLWILHHREIAGMESNAWVHGMRYSDAFIAEATQRREAAEALAGWEPTDGR